ncbi:hypothetical protein C4571_03045 [Candidatus Parcubacteria bacterium]|nr:MAG: hypothetical protein C4571_03045 [Candidatus Parcubacteria bacterium]
MKTFEKKKPAAHRMPHKPETRHAKLCLLVVSVTAALLLALPRTTRADWFDIGNIAFTIIGKVAFGISYLISVIGGIFIVIEAWFIQILLAINVNVTQSAPVAFGFPVALAIANLGFVIGIVVIAIMTILRSETYGVKQILWKLVVMAVLINFSLVIAGTILGFSDSLALYFLKGVDPGGSVGGETSGLKSFNRFASSLAGAFNPQKGILFEAGLNEAGSEVGLSDAIMQAGGEYEGAFAAVGSTFGKLFAPLAGIIFSVLAVFAIALTLAALIVMLLIRYVALGILLILMPFAWMLWVFPTFKSNWDKWWHQFLRWAFFSPIVLFFLWIGMQTSGQIRSGTGGYNFADYTSPKDSFWATISNLLANTFTPLVENLLQTAIIVGVMIGGLIAANKLSITGASAAVGMAKGAGDWALGRAKLYGKAKAGAVSGGIVGKIREKTSDWSGALAEKQRSAGLLGRAFYGAGKMATGYVARGTAAAEKGLKEDILKEYEEKSKGTTMEQINAGWTTASRPQKAAWMNLMAERKDLDRFNYYSELNTPEMRAIAKEFGTDNAIKYKERVNKTAMADHNTTGLFRQLEEAKTPEEKAQAEAALEQNQAALFARYKKSEFSWTQMGDFLKGSAEAEEAIEKLSQQLKEGTISKAEFDEEMSKKRDFGLTHQQIVTQADFKVRGMLQGAPDMALPLLSNLKQRGLDRFEGLFRNYVKEQRASLAAERSKLGVTAIPEQLANRMDALSRLEEKIKGAIVMNSVLTMGYGAEGEATAKRKESPATELPPAIPPTPTGGGGH